MHSVPVDDEGRVIRKLVAANLARALLQSSAVVFLVHPHVQAETIPAVEADAAGVATVLSLVLVDTSVLLQGRGVLEHFVAVGTLDTVLFVGVHVLGQAVEGYELVADGALSLIANWLVLAYPMMAQTRGILEVGAAVFAEVGPGRSVHRFQVKAELCLEGKLLRAFGALVDLLQVHVTGFGVLV